MNDSFTKQRIGVIVTIVDHGQGERVAHMYMDEQSHMVFQYRCHALGTASSEILDYLGLAETEKDVVISLLAFSRIPELLKKVNSRMQLSRPGNGIAFTLRLSALSSCVYEQLQGQNNSEEGGDCIMDREAKYELILVVVNRGYAEKTMDAAKSAGATGGTVLQARLLGHEEASKFMGISIKEEKEIIAIVVDREKRYGIMQAVTKEVGTKTEGKGILMSIPVDTMVGIGRED